MSATAAGAMAAMPERAMLGAPEVRRVLVSMIAAFQEELIREGRLPRQAHVSAVTSGLDDAARDALSIDEVGLGLDSLAVIDLVTRIAVFFNLAETGVEDYLLIRRGLGEWTELVVWHLEKVGPEARLTFETSGSTGRPTRHCHRRAALESEIVAHLAGPLAPMAGSRTTCVFAPVPAHHIYGFLWGVLLPHRAGWAAKDLPPGAPGPALRTARAGDIVLATPFTWDRIATSGLRFEPGVTGISSGGPTGPETWRAAEVAGLHRLIEIYGSSETAGVGWRDDPDADYVLLSDLVHGEDGPVRPGGGDAGIPDRLSWAGQDRFRVEGRRDSVVQVAGVNVNLADLRRLIREQPGVRDAALRLDGDRLKAFVVPDAPDVTPGRNEGLEDRLRAAMHALPPAARPDRFSFGATLPRTAIGKLADWDVAAGDEAAR
jgi:4-coumarate--CoA ligase (photoactive yellow protein activation family)